jgi:4-aminobutyrate aminotransferase-like enzyme/Ser/Thr protein kinase RdoA (MazF antagonist)
MDNGIATPDAGVLQAQPPRFAPERAAEIAAKLFGFDGESLKSLGSERDQNFLIENGAGERGVLKISNAGEDAATLDMETRAALHVMRVDAELPVAAPRPTAGHPDSYVASVPTSLEVPDAADAQAKHFVRMFSYLEGRASVDGTELDREAIRDFGVVLARLGRALRGFFHPSAGRVLLWDTQHTMLLRPMLHHIEDPDRRAVCARVLDAFEERILPAWPGLRAQVIHGDLTLDNVLLDDRCRIAGIVDFGDMSHTALLCDISAAFDTVLGGRGEDELFSAAAALRDGYERVTPLEQEELDVLGDVVAARQAATAIIAAWRTHLYPENAAYLDSWSMGVWAILEIYEDLGREEFARRLGARSHVAATTEELVRRRNEAVGTAISPLTYREPLHLVRGEGPWLYDAAGRRYLDAYNNVPVAGHGHPRVTEAVARQSRLLNTNMRYLHGSAIELAERLKATMPEDGGLDTVLFVNAGSEATDLAWRLATIATGNAGGLVTEFAYHGVSAAISALSPEEWKTGEQPEHVEPFPPPDLYRRFRGAANPYGDAAAAFGEAIERLAARGIRPAVTFVDGGFTSDGVFAPPAAYVQELVLRTHEAGGLFVADEVQAGYGRTGEHLWSFASYGIAPDFVTLGKPMGNGFPVAAVITRRELVDRLGEVTEFFSTFGGNPVAAEAGLAVLDVVRDEDLIGRAAREGERLRSGLEELQSRHKTIGDIRGRGLLLGVDLVANPETGEPNADLADAVVNSLRERGVLVGVTGPHENGLKIRPPLAIGDDEVDLLLRTLDASLVDLSA